MQEKTKEKRAIKVENLEMSGFSEKFIWHLLQESSEANEFKLFCLAQQWCQSNY